MESTPNVFNLNKPVYKMQKVGEYCMLIDFGNTTVLPDWELKEDLPTVYGRVYYVISGIVTYEDAKETKRLKPGFLYALPTSMPYHVWRDKSEDYVCTYMHIDYCGSNVNGLIEMNVPEPSCLFHYILAVQCAINEKKIELLEQLADCFQKFLEGNPEFTLPSEMLAQVQNYVTNHIGDELTVETLSKLFSYHPNYFARLFRQETGYTPYQFILQQRMQYAVNLLNKGMGNEEVCYACGYTNSSTFTRAFRKYFGVSPQKHKKGFRQP